MFSSNRTKLAWLNISIPFIRLTLLLSITFLSLLTLSSSALAITTNMATSSATGATQPSTMKHIVRTSENTIHSFIQMGTNTTKCGSGGLWWLYSTDSGSTWTCGGNFSSDTTNLMYASATVDSSDNVYVVYSMPTSGAGTGKSVYYRKLTKGSGTVWTLEAQQAVLSNTLTIGYHYATMELEGNTRLWLATRYHDGTNYQVSVYYSDGLGTAPTWTVSQATFDTAGTSSSYHYPSIVRFASNMGIIYSDQGSSGDLKWRRRGDGDGLTSWNSEITIDVNIDPTSPSFTATGDTAGNVYVAANDGAAIELSYFNGISWAAYSTVSSAAVANSFVSLSTDGTSAWVFYGETTGLTSGLSGSRKLVYKKCSPPFITASCDTSSTPVVSYHGVFDKYWSVVDNIYLDDTTDAGNTTSADTQMVSSTRGSGENDTLYFGKTEKFDAISWDVSTNGAGGVIAWEYWNGSTWSTLSFTASSNTNLQGDGWGSFTDPVDWATTQVNSESTPYYYIRARTTTNFATSPVGVEFDSIPAFYYPDATIMPDSSGKIYLIWTENASSPTKVRSSQVTVTTSAPNSASSTNLNPPLATYSSTTTATQPSTMRHIVRTSENTIHSFVQLGTDVIKCGSGGLWWLYSTDSGSTWSCGGNLSSDTTNLMYASATFDTSDNVYVTYSQVASTGGTTKNVYYRKLTKGVGSTWTLEAEQTVLSGSGTVGYHYATMELEGTTRLWLATRYYDGTNYQVSVYYSDGLSTTPVWAASNTSITTANTSAVYFIPILVRYGTKMSLIYNEQSTTFTKWRTRTDSDSITTWSPESTVFSSSSNPVTAATGDVNGNVYFIFGNTGATRISYYDGSFFSSPALLSVASNNTGNVSISTDGTNIWAFYGETSGLSTSLSGSRKLVYKKCSPPFTASDCDAAATPVVSYHRIFDKAWSEVSSAFTNITSVAGDVTSADTQMVTGVGDAIYFGQTEKYDAISWDVSTAGVGGQVAWEYWNGTSWVRITDFLGVSNTTFTADGYLSFIPNTDWVTTTVNSESTPYYYVRARTTTAYSTPPVGVQFASIPQVNWASATSTPDGSGKITVTWTENTTSPSRVRSTQITVLTSTPNTASTANISPAVAGYSSTTAATQPSTMKNVVKTSDGTLHSFLQMGTSIVTCGSGGLWWLYSIDNGSSWICSGNLSFDTTNLKYASAVVDATDNIYLVYSGVFPSASTSADVFYRKLTKGIGSSWLLETEQIAIDNTSSSKSFGGAVIELEDSERIWLATRYYDGSKNQVSAYYSSGLEVAPTWSISQTTLDSIPSATNRHSPSIVRFGAKIGIIYVASDASVPLYWRYRSDSDLPSFWSPETTVTDQSGMNGTAFTSVSDDNGNVYVAYNMGCSQTVRLVYYNGVSWSQPATVSSSAINNSFVGLSSDGENVWVFYGDAAGFSGTISGCSSWITEVSGSHKLVYKKGVPPYATSDFDANSTTIVSQYGLLDRVWSYVSGNYYDETADAANINSEDISMVSDLGDILYFGKSEKFDAISYGITTNGVVGQVAWEYWNGTSWVRITDFLGVSNTTFTADGYISFIPNTDWVTTTVNSESTSYYYVRARVITAYSTPPVGVEFSSIPKIYWASATARPDVGGNINVLWTENASSPTRVRSSHTTVNISLPNTATTTNISPPVVGYSTITTSTYPSTMKNLLRTSDGTLHAFVQSGSALPCSSSVQSNHDNGLNWIYSTNNGITWICGGNLSSDKLYRKYASATVDSSDNIYVVYSTAGSSLGTVHGVFFRKLTKGSGSAWSLEAEQIVLSSSASTGYHNAEVEIDSASRLWLAVKYQEDANGQISVFYSDGLGASPTWSQSITSLDTAGTSIVYGHVPLIVRFGTNIGIIYKQETTDVLWRYRKDTDDLTSWHDENVVMSNKSGLGHNGFSAVADINGNIYFTAPYSTNYLDFAYYNGSTWSTPATVSATASNVFSSLSSDGTNIWAIYGDTTGLSSGLSGSRKLVYKKGTPPFTSADFAIDSTLLISYHRIFDKAWSQVSSAFTDITTVAGDVTSADTQMVTGVGDAIYFGQTEKYDAISWDVSTAGVGGQVAWEYWNGTSWVRITDFLGVSNTTFTADGYLSFIPNTDWATTTVNSESTPYYYVRARVITAYSTSPVGVQFASIPQVNWGSFLPDVVDTNTLMGIWTENELGTARVRFTSYTNNSPDAPTSLGPSNRIDGSYTSDTTPKMTFSLSDDDISDTVKFRMQIDDSSDFSSPIIDYSSPFASQGAFSYTVGDSTGTYTTGSSSTRITDDGAYYWRVKGVDDSNDIGAWTKANGGGVAFRYDKTAPGDIEIVSPGDKWYISEDRPTFKWKATSDSGSGVTSSYKVEIDNGEAGDFIIDEIPASRTTDYETDKYIARYENFSDTDPDNNYISVHTKSSNGWGSDKNDGKLKEGKRSWKVSIPDTLGNQREVSRVVYLDITGPTLGFTQVNKYPLESGANTFSTSDTTPTIFGKIFDYLSGESSSTNSEFVSSNKVSSGPSKVEVKLEKKNNFGLNEVYLTTTVNLTENYWTDTGARIEDHSLNIYGKFSPFEYTPSSALPLDLYKVTITGFDKAGNSNSTTNFDLIVTTTQNVLTPEEKKVVDEETKTLQPELSKKALNELEITKQTAVSAPSKRGLMTPIVAIGSNIQQIVLSPVYFLKRVLGYSINVVEKGSRMIGEGAKKPKTLLAKIGQWLSYSVVTFPEMVLDDAPTNISGVHIAHVTKNSVVITWKTNHHTFNNKINFGKDKTYGKSASSSDWQKKHKVQITGLSPNTKYLFEVMSQGKNYTYDANYEFRTKKN